MENENRPLGAKNPTKAIIIVSIILILAILILAIILTANKEVTKEELIQNVKQSKEATYTYASDYLEKWKFPAFDEKTLSGIEARYIAYYYKEVPGAYAAAKGTAELFLEHLYDQIDITDKNIVTKALAACYITAVGDTYGVYREAADTDEFASDLGGEHVGIGISVINGDSGVLILEVMNNSPAKAAGLLAGDIIIKVEDCLYQSSEYETFVGKIRGEAGTEVTITVKRADSELTFTMKRAKVVHETITSEMLAGNVGYLKISEFKQNTPALFKEHLSKLVADGARGIVFDVRSNPGGYLSSVTEMLSLLVPTGTNIVSFSNSKRVTTATHGTSLEPTDSVLSLPTVVLTNKNTASAAELFAAALRDYNDMGLMRAEVLGETTFKKGVMQSILSLADGATLTMTTAYYMPPLGECYDEIGVIPDIYYPDDESLISKALIEIENLVMPGSAA